MQRHNPSTSRSYEIHQDNGLFKQLLVELSVNFIRPAGVEAFLEP